MVRANQVHDSRPRLHQDDPEVQFWVEQATAAEAGPTSRQTSPWFLPSDDVGKFQEQCRLTTWTQAEHEANAEEEEEYHTDQEVSQEEPVEVSQEELIEAIQGELAHWADAQQAHAAWDHANQAEQGNIQFEPFAPIMQFEPFAPTVDNNRPLSPTEQSLDPTVANTPTSASFMGSRNTLRGINALLVADMAPPPEWQPYWLSDEPEEEYEEDWEQSPPLWVSEELAEAANAHFANHEWGLSQSPSQYLSPEGSMPSVPSPATATWRLAREVMGPPPDSDDSVPDRCRCRKMGHPLCSFCAYRGRDYCEESCQGSQQGHGRWAEVIDDYSRLTFRGQEQEDRFRRGRRYRRNSEIGS